MSKFYELTIKEVKQETPYAVSIEFNIPESLKEIFSFKAGQYLTLKHSIDEIEFRRSYSIWSSPKSDRIKVGIKKLSNGIFSVFANEKLKSDDILEVMPPQGKFILDPVSNASKNYVAFAAGSGITPVLSIVQTVLEQEPKSTFLLVYGNKSIKETMFYNNLIELQKEYSERFNIEFIFSQILEKNAPFGRIDKSLVNFFLKNKYKDKIFHEFYLCGPEPMIKVVSSTLKENGVDDAQISYELFTTSKEELSIENLDGNTLLTVTVDDETQSFTMPQSKTVLEAVLEKDIDAPYSCQGGICATCIARIKEGKAVMRKNEILTDEEIAEDFILTCQAQPTTPTLVIDYDDV